MTKRALVLSGGGSKGAYQVGALKALVESGKTWNSVYGISVGALNAAWFALHKPEEQQAAFPELLEIWKNVKSSADIYKPWASYKMHYVYSIWKGSLNSGAPLRSIVTKLWDKEKHLNSGVKLTVGCSSLTTTRYHNFDGTHPNIMEYILASSHLPVVFEPLEIDGELWADGGLRHQIPFLEALRDNPDEIDVIVTQPVTNYEITTVENKSIRSAIKVSLRTAELFSDQVYFRDCMDVIEAMNDEGKKHNVKINFYVPSKMPNKDSMNFDGDTIQEVIKMGYEETLVKLNSSNV